MGCLGGVDFGWLFEFERVDCVCDADWFGFVVFVVDFGLFGVVCGFCWLCWVGWFVLIVLVFIIIYVSFVYYTLTSCWVGLLFGLV